MASNLQLAPQVPHPAHMASTTYLFLGLHGYYGLVPWIWTAIGLNTLALVILYLPVHRGLRYLNVACVCLIAGIWIEKGMGLVVPAFIPSPLGKITEYTPTAPEIAITVGVYALGAMVLTMLYKIVLNVRERLEVT